MASFVHRSGLCLVVLLARPELVCAVPVAELSATEPGLNLQIPFMGPDAFGNTFYGYPTQWGGVLFNGTLGLSVDNRLVTDSDNGFMRYNTTFYGVNPAMGSYTVTPMNVSKDWVLSVEWESDMQESTGTVFRARSTAADIARLQVTGAGAYQLQGGNGSASLVSIRDFAQGYLQANTKYTLTLHYKAASQLLDFYINSNLEAANFPATGSTPVYAIEYLQIGGGPAPVTAGLNYFDNIKIGLRAVTAHPGDFDSDGDVDGADFVAWQTNFPKANGAVLTEGDADTDGDIDGADFVVWQTNFPFTPSLGGVSVPEPKALCIYVIGVAIFYLQRRVSF